MDASEEEDEVAQAMGFGTFGSKPAAKRRKVMDDVSGANNTALGIRQPRTSSVQTDSDSPKGSLDDSAAIESSARPTDPTLPDSVAHQAGHGGKSSPDSESSKKKNKKKSTASPGLAGFLSRAQNIPTPVTGLTTSAQPQPDGAINEDRNHHPNDPRVPFMEPQIHSSATTQLPHPVLRKTLQDLDQQDLYELRRGVRGADGDMVFFQPNFIEDPWARLKSGAQHHAP
jgi:hypothetical protein